jgi:hypothetical protein
LRAAKAGGNFGYRTITAHGDDSIVLTGGGCFPCDIGSMSGRVGVYCTAIPEKCGGAVRQAHGLAMPGNWVDNDQLHVGYPRILDKFCMMSLLYAFFVSEERKMQ